MDGGECETGTVAAGVATAAVVTQLTRAARLRVGALTVAQKVLVSSYYKPVDERYFSPLGRLSAR